ncbi:hypothetical protein ADK74_17395 [Streptomyces decoyicus]|nr:hypothetical protein ADK74_17395 [Streptomyces decoyicus]
MRGELGAQFVEVEAQGVGLPEDGDDRVRQGRVGGDLAEPVGVLTCRPAGGIGADHARVRRGVLGPWADLDGVCR